jgi:hypothetical protein
MKFKYLRTEINFFTYSHIDNYHNILIIMKLIILNYQITFESLYLIISLSMLFIINLKKKCVLLTSFMQCFFNRHYYLPLLFMHQFILIIINALDIEDALYSVH